MKKILFAILILFLFPAVCLAGSRAKKEVKRGNLLYNKGEFDEALKKYEEALEDSPDLDIPNFNLGAALYKTESYQAAARHFERSLLTEDQFLEQRASYNTGNADYKYGISKEDTDLAGAVDLLKKSLRRYQRAIELEPEDKDAKHNYEFVKKELERLQKKLQQQPKEQQKQKKQDPEKQKEKKQEPESKKEQQEKDKDKEKEESSQQQAEPEEKEEEEKPEQQEEEEQRAGARPEGEMSEEEASALLENYHREEEPRGLYKEKIPVRGMPEVLKDW